MLWKTWYDKFDQISNSPAQFPVWYGQEMGAFKSMSGGGVVWCLVWDFNIIRRSQVK